MIIKITTKYRIGQKLYRFVDGGIIAVKVVKIDTRQELFMNNSPRNSIVYTFLRDDEGKNIMTEEETRGKIFTSPSAIVDYVRQLSKTVKEYGSKD